MTKHFDPRLPRESLCYSCKFAYGNLCFSYPFVERKWIMKYAERMTKVQVLAPNKAKGQPAKFKDVPVRIVIKCKNYAPGRQPLGDSTIENMMAVFWDV